MKKPKTLKELRRRNKEEVIKPELDKLTTPELVKIYIQNWRLSNEVFGRIKAKHQKNLDTEVYHRQDKHETELLFKKRLRENIRCSECGKRTTCFKDLGKVLKSFYLCKECKEKVKKLYFD